MVKRLSFIFAAVIVILLAVHAVREKRASEDVTSKQQPYSQVAPGSYDFSFQADGLERAYRVHVPAGYSPQKTYPVVLGLHGGFGTAKQFETSSGLSKLADERGFIAVYGQGTAWGVLKAPVWNAGGCCGQAVDTDKNVDDVGYAREVIRRVKSDYRVDTGRVYVTGMSNGGMMSNRLACEASDVFAGAAVVSGTIQVGSCSPVKRMPILIIHGTDDENVPYNGGVGSKQINQSTAIPVEQGFAEWGNRNGCSGIVSTEVVKPLGDDGNTVDRLTYPSCDKPVVLYRINGGEHEWPGGESTDNQLERPSPTKVMNASQTIIDFFNL